MKTLKFFLDHALPLLCLFNMIVWWNDSNTFTAWLVAFTGWSANLIHVYKNKKHDNN